jgi:hypothetical protein
MLLWEDGILVFAEGDIVEGPLHTRGDQFIELVGHGTMSVRVEGWSLDFAGARDTLRSRCDLGADAVVW